MILQQIWLGGQHWTFPREASFPGGEAEEGRVPYAPRSRALVCPRCLRIWARLQAAEDLWFQPEGVACEDCAPPMDHLRSWNSVPGSLLVEEGYGIIDTALLAALPPDLAKREFDLHMKHFDLEQWNNEA